MNKALLIAVLSALIFSACKKEGTPKIASAAFTASVKNNAYIGQTITFKLNSPTTSKDTIVWDYGSGPNSFGPVGSYAYDAPGIYTITCWVNRMISTQKIRIYPGTFSYQVKNATGVDITSLDTHSLDTKNAIIIDNVFPTFPNGSTLDTIFVNLSQADYGQPVELVGTFLTSKANSVTFVDDNNLSKFNGHVVFTLGPNTQANFTVPNSGSSVASQTGTIGYVISNF
jgi:hypothetical protein